MVLNSKDPTYMQIKLDKLRRKVRDKYLVLRVGEISSRKLGPYLSVIFYKEYTKILVPTLLQYHYNKTVGFRLEQMEKFNKRFKPDGRLK